MLNGEVELEVTGIEILSKALDLPFELNESVNLDTHLDKAAVEVDVVFRPDNDRIRARRADAGKTAELLDESVADVVMLDGFSADAQCSVYCSQHYQQRDVINCFEVLQSLWWKALDAEDNRAWENPQIIEDDEEAPQIEGAD